MKVSLFRPESQKLTESWFVFIPFRYRSNDVSKKSRVQVGRSLGWQQVGSIPPISNFIPLPSHQEVYCNSAEVLSYFCVILELPWVVEDSYQFVGSFILYIKTMVMMITTKTLWGILKRNETKMNMSSFRCECLEISGWPDTSERWSDRQTHLSRSEQTHLSCHTG